MAQLLSSVPVILGLLQLGAQLTQIRFGACEVGFCLNHGRVRLVHVRDIEGRINVGEYCPRFYCGAIVDRLAALVLPERNDPSGHLGADVNHLLRLNGSGRADRDRQVFLLYR